MTVAIVATLIGVGRSAVNVVFERPVIIGSSNSSHFYFPAVIVAYNSTGATSTATSISIAQSVTLCDDVHTCAGKCAQILRSRDGGQTWELQKTVHHGGTGSFNYYGDLGQRLPVSTAPGTFITFAGNNGGSWLGRPIVLQHWSDDGGAAASLRLVQNSTANLLGIPAAFMQGVGGLGQSGAIVRVGPGVLLTAFYGYANDTPASTCNHRRCYTIALFRSFDDGITWNYTARLDQTAAMPTAVEGPCEPTLVVLRDSRVLLVFRLQSGQPLWKTYSSDAGVTWTEPQPTSAWAVWPQLLLLSNGVLVLTSGRPGLGLWVSAKGDGGEWEFHNVAAAHNSFIIDPLSDPLAFTAKVANVTSHTSPAAVANGRQTTAYTGLAEVSPGVVLLTYDRLRVGCPDNETEAWCQAHKRGYGPYIQADAHTHTQH